MTIQDIARRAGVSASTVSRVLNGDIKVKDKTRARVKQVISQMHYIPNNNARNLKRLQSKLIGVLVKGIDNLFFLDILKVIEKKVHEAGYAIILEHADIEEDELTRALALIKERRLQGIFILGGSLEHTASLYAQLSVPGVYVTISARPESPALFSSVAIDDEAEARRAMSYLIGLGHRRILMISSSPLSRYVNRLRISGCKQAMAINDVPFNEELLVQARENTSSAGYEAANWALDRGLDFSGVFAFSDILAIGACRALMDRELRIPEDLSVMGFDGIELSRYWNPVLTSVKQPTSQIALTAVDTMIDLIAGRTEHIHRVFAGEIRLGGSCRVLNVSPSR